MAKPSASDIRVAVKSLASDADLMKMFSLNAQQLEAYRGEIDRARADAMVSMKFIRMREQARRVTKQQRSSNTAE